MPDATVERVLDALSRRLARDRKNELPLDAPEENDVDEDENDGSCSPIVVFDSIDRQAFRHWLESNEGELRRWQYEPLTPTTGRVVVYTHTRRVHARTASRITLQVVRQVVRIGDDMELMDTLALDPAPTMDVGDRDQEPTMSLVPSCVVDNETFPTLIVEVAYTHESWAFLVAKLHRWMRPQTTVQVAIGVHIGNVRRRLIML
ncbi:hypothetical protein Poli38472_007283 [Pythium oligandrum]|uniref:Uncharacterized protein n=1 Tax=Pythium oligandrum TaxID=41045 RepID=A0A8K1CAI0_PYTOL|nr:hypothetical protein Poli38472_007283 [Pythium oligandrum]|eukprot:TMW59138.1 hypothetical protein Poli38472_007283 [Pythium oligandrum]